VLVFGRFALQPERRRLLQDGDPVAIGARAFDVLLALVERRERIVTKTELLDLAWPGLVVEENNLQVQVSFLRKILGANAIATIPGRGYRFALDIEQSAGDPSIDAKGTATQDFIESIAVLPFANLSGEVENEAFADGLAEELLNVLSKIHGLRVVSRTSSFYFKGKAADISTIASRLNVGTVVEGSVRRSGTRVRVAVQLIHVASDSHLWSGTYDRELVDIFAIQDEIASSVVTELRSGARHPAKALTWNSDAETEVAFASRGRTTNPEALQNFLQARFFSARQTPADRAKSLDYYERALSLDPNFASAWAAMASALAGLAGYGGSAPVAETFRRARAAAQRALNIEPDLSAAHSTLSWIQLYCDWDWKGAEASIRRALQLAPNDVRVLKSAAIVVGNLGQTDEAVTLVRRASQLDPLDAIGHRHVAMVELDLGHLDAAHAAISRALDFNPQLSLTYFTLGLTYLSSGHADKALEAFGKEALEDYRLLGVTLAHHALGRSTESAAALDQLIEHHADVSPCQVAEAYAYMGEADAAFEWLDRAYASRNPRLVEIRGDSLLGDLHQHPRWLPFLRQIGFGI